jgi:hypothetical protein
MDCFVVSLLHKELPSDGIAVRRTASLPLACDRTIRYAAACQFSNWRLWNTGSPAFAEDDSWGVATSHRPFAMTTVCSPDDRLGTLSGVFALPSFR